MGSAKLQGVQLSINKESFLLINITREAKGRAEALTTVCRVISGAGMCASIKEKQGKKVYIENERVYDKNFNRLQRCLLTNLDIDEARVIREVILSGSGEVELNDKPSEIDEYYLKEYFGDKIRFGKGFFVKNR